MREQKILLHHCIISVFHSKNNIRSITIPILPPCFILNLLSSSTLKQTTSAQICNHRHLQGVSSLCYRLCCLQQGLHGSVLHLVPLAPPHCALVRYGVHTQCGVLTQSGVHTQCGVHTHRTPRPRGGGVGGHLCILRGDVMMR